MLLWFLYLYNLFNWRQWTRGMMHIVLVFIEELQKTYERLTTDHSVEIIERRGGYIRYEFRGRKYWIDEIEDVFEFCSNVPETRNNHSVEVQCDEDLLFANAYLMKESGLEHEDISDWLREVSGPRGNFYGKEIIAEYLKDLYKVVYKEKVEQLQGFNWFCSNGDMVELLV